MKEAAAPDGHEQFRQLSALANTGTLSDIEWSELRDHLRLCQACREVHEQYRLLEQAAIPMLASVCGSGEDKTGWDDAAVRRNLFARIREAERDSKQWNFFRPPSASLSNGKFWTPLSPLAVAVLAFIVLLVGGGAYHWNRSIQPRAQQTASADSGLQTLLAERDAARQRAGIQENRIVELQAESSRRDREITKLKSALRIAGERSNDLAAAKGNADEQLRVISGQRDALTAQLRDAQQSDQSIQAELASLRSERDQALQRTSSLEAKIQDLSASNREQERALKDDRQYLASDRDIRELMGARKLYIADVFDVDSGSRTRKPFGRVFYTQGKSLVFYAFDLDPGLKNAKAFQVWGRKEMPQGDQPRPMNLGILYMDSESNHRWVMRFDDPKQLAEIDAVFVTVEPNGGSPKPTSKPFLYALLRKEVNHP